MADKRKALGDKLVTSSEVIAVKEDPTTGEKTTEIRDAVQVKGERVVQRGTEEINRETEQKTIPEEDEPVI